MERTFRPTPGMTGCGSVGTKSPTFWRRSLRRDPQPSHTALACGGMSTRANLPISRTACRRRFEFSTMARRR